jgi:hypothetical protein
MNGLLGGPGLTQFRSLTTLSHHKTSLYHLVNEGRVVNNTECKEELLNYFNLIHCHMNSLLHELARAFTAQVGEQGRLQQ